MAIQTIKKLEDYVLTNPAGLQGEIQFNNGGSFDTNSTFVYDTSTNRLGVGISSPNEKLVVAGAIRSTSNAVDWAASDGSIIDYLNGDTRIVAARNGANSSNMTFTTYNAGVAGERVRIDPLGNVGINQSNPATRLQIEDNGDGNIVRIKGTGTNAAGRAIDIGVGNTDVSALETQQTYIYTTATNSANSGLVLAAEGGTSAQGGVLFYTGIVGSLTQRMRITRDGNTGIGVDDPAYKFHVVNEGLALRVENTNTSFAGNAWQFLANDYAIVDAGASNYALAVFQTSRPITSPGSIIKAVNSVEDVFVVKDNGNVGIGVNPQARLHVAGDNDTEVIRVGGAGDAGGVQGSAYIGISHFKPNGTQTYSPIRIGAKEIGIADWRADLVFETRDVNSDSAPVERMRITDDGNVGIGIDNPYSTLTIQGNNYVKTNSGTAVDGIALGGGSTGEGNYTNGLSVGFGGGSAAISGVQLTNDSDAIGLSFFTHPSGTGANDSIEMMRLNGTGLAIGTTSQNLNASTALHIENTNSNHITILRAFDINGAASEQIGVIRGGAINTAGDPEIGASIGLGIYDVDGVGGGTDLGGSIIFNTRNNGGSTPTEKMRINNDGAIERSPLQGSGYSYEFLYSEVATTDLSVDITLDTDANFWHPITIEATVSYVNNQIPRGTATFLIFFDCLNGAINHQGDAVQASVGTIPTLSVSVSTGGAGLQETITLTFNTWDGAAVAHRAIGHFKVLTTYENGSRITHS